MLEQRVKFGHRASKTTGTLLKKPQAKVMAMVWPSMSPDQDPENELLCFLKQKVEETEVSNIHHLRHVVMEEWKGEDSNGIQ